MSEPDDSKDTRVPAEKLEGQSRSKRFRFKDKQPSRSRSPISTSSSHGRHRHYRRRHHQGRHRPRNASPPPSPQPDADTAFRTSLFDALADDEGAAYWEGVYGQPIHNYSDTKLGPDGELERMTDEEYTTYVRRKMWEKSWEGVEEERKARARARAEEEKAKDQAEQSNATPGRSVFDVDIEESLKRGEKRKQDKAWKREWESYLKKWSDLNAVLEQQAESSLPPETSRPRNSPWPWPVSSSKTSDIDSEEVETFFRRCTAASSKEHPSLALMTALKTERIRWHPDKVQQRFGNLGVVDEEVLRGVTAVFQIVDRLWNEERGKV